jgi:hypothetical protein
MAVKNPKKKKIVYHIRDYTRTIPKHNYLKYWRVVRYWALRNYDLKMADLDMIMFLYDERLFTRKDFDVYDDIMFWDKKRFAKLKRDGWIGEWRKRDVGRNEGAIYELTFKGKNMCADIYAKLNYEEDFSMTPDKNLIMKGKTYMDKMYVKSMIEFNREKREYELKHSHKES